MKNNGEIFNVWSFNGTVNFKFSENGNINKVYHHSDIEYFLYEDSINPSRLQAKRNRKTARKWRKYPWHNDWYLK